MSDTSIQMQGENLTKLNAIRVIIVLIIALGYASTMPIGPGNPEKLAHLGHDPSWIGIQILFFLSGYLGLRSLRRHGSGFTYLSSRIIRNLPLLAFVTAITVLVLFPIFGNSQATFAETSKVLTVYFLGTISCINPGEPLPGLLDDAKYMCIIQGAIWTLKWGVVAHLAAILGHMTGLFKNNKILAFLAIAAALSYFVLNFLVVWLEKDIPGSLEVASRLAWPFIAGMAVFAYKAKLSKSVKTNLLIATVFFVSALVWFTFLPWTPAIEILLTCAWGWLAITLIWLPENQMKFLNKWPALALAIYLINWPTAQILLLIFPEITPWQLIAMALPFTAIFAMGAHKLISGPSYRRADAIALQTA